MSKERSFSFDFPVDIFKDKDENWKIKGLASTEDKDLQGEIIRQNGFDLSEVEKGRGIINWEHRNDPSNIVGVLDSAKISDKGLEVTGQLFHKHTQAKSIYQILSSLDKNHRHRIQMSVEGKVIEKENDENDKNIKIINRAKLTGVALTMNPVNPSTYAELVKSLGASLDTSAGQPSGGGFDSSFPPTGEVSPSVEEKNDLETKIENVDQDQVKDVVVIEKSTEISEEKASEPVVIEEKVDGNQEQVQGIVPGEVGSGNNDSNIVDSEENKPIDSVVQGDPKAEISTIAKSTGAISIEDGEKILNYLQEKIALSNSDPIHILKSLRENLLKGDAEDYSMTDELDMNGITELFNDLRDTIANSYAYEDVEKFDKMKDHIDKGLKQGDVEKLKKMQKMFLNWHHKLYKDSDARYSDVANKLRSFAVSLNVLIHGLTKKHKELSEKMENEDSKKSVEEENTLEKSNKVEKDGSNVDELKTLIKKKINENKKTKK